MGPHLAPRHRGDACAVSVITASDLTEIAALHARAPYNLGP